MYSQESAPVNELSGFTKAFVKRTKDKREEDGAIKDLLAFYRENRVNCGAKVCEKALKNLKAHKVYFANNCDELTQKKLSYYAKLSGVEVTVVDLDNNELGKKLSKPFQVSTVWINKEVSN